MPHPDDLELLLLSDGELPSPQAAALRHHLAVCSACREREQEIRLTLASALPHRTIALPPPDRARAQLQLRLSAAGRLWPVCAAAACAAFFLLYQAARPRDLSEPKYSLTPGETRPITVGDVCRGENTARIIPASLREQVFREYGIAHPRPSAYEVDYLITPELGGADSVRNLWPQPYSIVWNAHVKDALEDRLHQLVCEGQLDLATAQREIAADWIAAYKKYFHTDRPLPNPG